MAINPITSILLNKLESLKKLIDYYELENKLLGAFDEKEDNIILINLSNCLKDFRLDKLSFNYNSIIISLYGFLEQYLEEIVKDYIENLNLIITKFDLLPEKISKNHFNLSLNLISKVESSKYKGPLTKEFIINNLHSCINQYSNYKLTKEAFSQHSANFRVQVIDETFAQIGIENLSNLLIKDSEFITFLYGEGIIESLDNISVNSSLSYINELAELRNFVAHGISNDIIGNDMLKKYVNFLYHYGIAIDKVITNNLLLHSIPNNYSQLGEIKNLYQNGNVICLFNNNNTLNIGDTIIGKNSVEIVQSKILGIRLDDNDIESINHELNVEIGIRLERPFKANYTVFVKKQKPYAAEIV